MFISKQIIKVSNNEIRYKAWVAKKLKQNLFMSKRYLKTTESVTTLFKTNIYDKV